MLSPTYLESLPVGIVDQYAELESYIIADIARRIAGAEYIMTPTAEWQIKKAQELRLSYDEIQTQVAKQLGKTKKEVKEIFKEAGVKAIRADASIHALAGKEKECTEFLNSLATNRVFQEGIKQTNGLMTNFCRSLASESNKVFGQLLDQAYFECQSGAFSQQSAIRKAVKQLGKQGITMIRYPSGHRETTEVAVRRAIITGTNITAARLQLDLAREVECDLVEVTSHFGARPSHQEWQGGIYSISGKHRKYESLEQATGYGTGEGLCGFNCRHNFYPFYEGISIHLGNPHDAKESNEFYELTQKQRALERNVRKAKREVEAYKAAAQVSNDEALLSDLKKARDKLADNNAELRQFISEHEKLTLRRDRLMIGKGGSTKLPSHESKPKDKKTPTLCSAKTINEAQKWAVDNLGMKNVNLSGIGVEVANRINNTLSRAFEQYPILKGFVKDMKTSGRLSAVAQAEISFSNGKMNTALNLSKKSLADLEQIDKMIERNVNSQWWTPKNGVDGIIEHELGHMTEYAVVMKRCGIDFNCTDIDQIRDLFSELRSKSVSAGIKEKALHKLGIEDSKISITKNLSEYGATNSSEFLAEAVSEVCSGKGRELAKEVVRLLKEVIG